MTMKKIITRTLNEEDTWINSQRNLSVQNAETLVPLLNLKKRGFLVATKSLYPSVAINAIIVGIRKQRKIYPKGAPPFYDDEKDYYQDNEEY